MSFEAKPYSPEVKGDLLEYLRRCDHLCDNLFHGFEHFIEMRNMEIMIPRATCLRVSMNPMPDIGYFVNDDFMLESIGRGPPKMDMVGADKGVYDPRDALKDRFWSIHCLDLYRDRIESETAPTEI